MRRYFVLLLALLVLCVSGLVYADVCLVDQRDRVELKQNVVYGDEKYAEGVTVNSRVQLKHQLFWETTHQLGQEKKLETEYSFSSSRLYEHGVQERSFFEMFNDTDIGLEVYERFFGEIAPGESREKVIKLSELYEFYPMYFDVEFNGLRFFRFGDSIYDEGSEQLYTLLNDFFRIPVLENDYISIHLERSNSGNDYSYGWGSNYEESWDSYSIYTQHVALQNTMYFTVNNRSDDNVIMDFSNVPGGYGIYAFKYDPADGSMELEMVYSLPEDEQVSYFTLDARGNFALVTVSEEGIMLTVIDPDSMETLQKLEISRGEGETVYTLFPDDDFWVFELIDNRIALLTLDEDGVYSHEFTVELDPVGGMIYLSGREAMDWNGERLALAWYRTPGEMLYNSYVPDYYVAVYDSSGMLFFGEYDSSLSSRAECETPLTNGTVYCMDYDSMKLSWN